MIFDLLSQLVRDIDIVITSLVVGCSLALVSVFIPIDFNREYAIEKLTIVGLLLLYWLWLITF